MNYQKNGNYIALRLEIGEEIVSSIKKLCKEENIKYACISGIGASKKATVGCYRLSEKKYYEKTFDEPMEIVSLVGNITEKDKEPYIHLHASFSGEDCNVVGGHLIECVIAITSEIFINIFDGEMGRRTDTNTGTNILDI